MEKKDVFFSGKISIKDKIRGTFEEILSKGTVSIIMSLAMAVVSIIFIFGALLVIMNLKPSRNGDVPNFMEAIWQSFLRVIDPGAIQNDELWGYRIVSVIVTLFGVFIFGTLVGILTTGLDNLFIEMRKGKTEIVKKDFTLILGWSPTIFKIISELVISNANHRNKSIVILAGRDKIEMEDEINLKVNQKELLKVYRKSYAKSFSEEKTPKTYQTKIYCRSGNITDLDNLNLVHPENAESVVILASEEEKNDIETIKCILALRNKVKKIITEIKDEDNKSLMEFCLNGENENIFYIPSEKWLSRITAQASRQPGFSVIAMEILNYEKDEIYFFKADREIIGKTFKEVALNCVSSVVLGIHKKKLDKNLLKEKYIKEFENPGKLLGLKRNIVLNPYEKFNNTGEENIGCIIEEGDELILLQADDGKPVFDFKPLPEKEYQWKNSMEDVILPQTGILILGFNKKIYKIIKEIYEYISPDSRIDIVAEISQDKEREIRKSFKNVNILNSEITDYRTYEKELNGSKFDLESYESIIVLGYDNLNIQEKDAKSMLTMLLIKKIMEKTGKSKLEEKNVVIEIYDEKNREIVELTEVSDFIINETIISSVISQLSEEKRLYYVFDELLGGEGCEIYLFSVENYIENFQREYTFRDLSAIVANETSILLGYRKMEERDMKDRNYGVYLNSDRDRKIKLNRDDRLIVLFEGGN